MRTPPSGHIPLRPAPSGPAAVQALPGEPPYHVFLLTSMALAIGAGFALATLIPLSIVLDWGWGARYLPLVQAHGQVQVLGWLGLFIMGMAYRLMPRFSGRPLRFPLLAWVSWAALAMALIMRLVGQIADGGAWQQAVLIGSGALGVVSGAAFFAVVSATLLHRDSRAGATGYFFLLGSVAFLVQAGVNLALLVQMAQRGDEVVSVSYGAGLLHIQLYGFIAMFVLGVATRAVPTFSGLPRPELQAKGLALALAAAVTTFVVAALLLAAGGRSAGLYRLEAGGFASLGLVFLAGAWLVGIFRPAANRVAAASQQHIWFIRTAFAWLLVAAGLAGYYGVRGVVDGAPVSFYGIDAVRHALGAGFASLMIMGMGMLVLPEFAIRRIRYPSERALPLIILVLLNAATALRVGAVVATPHWLSPDRYWPMAVGGALSETAIILFAAMFVWSMWQKRGIVESIPLSPAGREGASLPIRQR